MVSFPLVVYLFLSVSTSLRDIHFAPSLQKRNLRIHVNKHMGSVTCVPVSSIRQRSYNRDRLAEAPRPDSPPLISEGKFGVGRGESTAILGQFSKFPELYPLQELISEVLLRDLSVRESFQGTRGAIPGEALCGIH